MAKRIVAIYDRGIDKNLMQGFDVLEKYGYELTLVEKTVNEDELAYQNSMLSVEVNGPDGTPINEEVFQYLDDAEIIITHFAPREKGFPLQKSAFCAVYSYVQNFS